MTPGVARSTAAGPEIPEESVYYLGAAPGGPALFHEPVLVYPGVGRFESAVNGLMEKPDVPQYSHPAGQPGWISRQRRRSGAVVDVAAGRSAVASARRHGRAHRGAGGAAGRLHDAGGRALRRPRPVHPARTAHGVGARHRLRHTRSGCGPAGPDAWRPCRSWSPTLGGVVLEPCAPARVAVSASTAPGGDVRSHPRPATGLWCAGPWRTCRARGRTRTACSRGTSNLDISGARRTGDVRRWSAFGAPTRRIRRRPPPTTARCVLH